jgi:hypothetical protein
MKTVKKNFYGGLRFFLILNLNFFEKLFKKFQKLKSYYKNIFVTTNFNNFLAKIFPYATPTDLIHVHLPNKESQEQNSFLLFALISR